MALIRSQGLDIVEDFFSSSEAKGCYLTPVATPKVQSYSHALPYHCHHSCSACVSRYRRYAKKLTAKQMTNLKMSIVRVSKACYETDGRCTYALSCHACLYPMLVRWPLKRAKLPCHAYPRLCACVMPCLWC